MLYPDFCASTHTCACFLYIFVSVLDCFVNKLAIVSTKKSRKFDHGKSWLRQILAKKTQFAKYNSMPIFADLQ